jgi:hypothetical protein
MEQQLARVWVSRSADAGREPGGERYRRAASLRQRRPDQIRTEITRVRSPTFTDRQLPDLFEAPADLKLHHGVERAGESHRQLWLDWMQEERSRPPWQVPAADPGEAGPWAVAATS